MLLPLVLDITSYPYFPLAEVSASVTLFSSTPRVIVPGSLQTQAGITVSITLGSRFKDSLCKKES